MNRTITETFKATRGLPQAIIKQSHSARLYWLIPLGAVCLCGWFAYRDSVTTGPTISIYFQDADGLEEGSTQLKYRGAVVGQVKTVELSKDNQQVKVRAQLTGSARNLASAGSMFWIVRPEIKVGSVSGLRTIISGEYVAIQPGKGSKTNVFVGAEKEPISDEPRALRVSLTTSNLGSMQLQE
jgi:paraquat-inducible protein B